MSFGTYMWVNTGLGDTSALGHGRVDAVHPDMLDGSTGGGDGASVQLLRIQVVLDLLWCVARSWERSGAAGTLSAVSASCGVCVACAYALDKHMRDPRECSVTVSDRADLHGFRRESVAKPNLVSIWVLRRGLGQEGGLARHPWRRWDRFHSSHCPFLAPVSSPRRRQA